MVLSLCCPLPSVLQCRWNPLWGGLRQHPEVGMYAQGTLAAGHTLRHSSLNCQCHSGNSSEPTKCQTPFSGGGCPGFSGNCLGPQSPVISTLTPSWPFGDCPKTERHTSGPNPASKALGFCDAPKQKENPGIRSPTSPVPPLGFETRPEAPIPALPGRILRIPSVLPLNPKPQTHPDTSFPPHSPGDLGQLVGAHPFVLSHRKVHRRKGFSSQKLVAVPSSTAGSHQPLPASVGLTAGARGRRGAACQDLGARWQSGSPGNKAGAGATEQV